MDRKPFIVILIGNSNVGKTSLSKCFADDNYDESKNKPTIRTESFFKSVLVNGKPIPIRIVDTAGQETYKAVPRLFYRNADAVIFVYDVTDKKTFLELPDWVEDVRQFGCNIKFRVLVGNKSDLEDQRQVPRVDGETFAENHNMLFEEVSASKSSKHLVDQLFVHIAEELVDLAKVQLTIERDSWSNLPLNLLLVGEPSVGTSCLAETYAMGKVSTPNPTQEFTAFCKEIDIDGEKVKIYIVAFPSQGQPVDKYKQYFQLENITMVLVYDVTNPASLVGFEEAAGSFNNSNILLKVLLGNKTDKINERKVPQHVGKALAKKHDMMYLELSARDPLMTAKGFDEIARTVFNIRKLMRHSNAEDVPEQILQLIDAVSMKPANDGTCYC